MSLLIIAMCVPLKMMAGDSGRKTAITNFRAACGVNYAKFIRKSEELFKILNA
jgi:hypothetical protein